MKSDFTDRLRLKDEKENPEIVNNNIQSGIVFRGTNLWILVFAIFVASLGLNVNSTAVIIGAMLISPLMGPIMGIGYSVGINNATILKKSIYNYLVATFTALTTSTIYFLITPLYDAHSEILARTTPTVYDVVIALFGGFAGMLATASKIKGNVIPGVAIATALMPPLCTAGYGIATLRLNFFLGAIYLYIINSVFIAVAAFLVVKSLRYPRIHMATSNLEIVAKRTIYLVVLITLIPSVYFAYDLVKRDEFNKNAEKFISIEANFPNDYLLNKKIDSKERHITLIYGGREISEAEIKTLKGKLKNYHLQDTKLNIRQGFAYDNARDESSDKTGDQTFQLLQQASFELNEYKRKDDSLRKLTELGKDIHSELKIIYPSLISSILQPAIKFNKDSTPASTFLAVLKYNGKLQKPDLLKIETLLKKRLKTDSVLLILE
ncbi:DUF389 domain-containing protein [Pollutibacter soli]|uniref:DUF389 domain-containing protein n=1 Tax=Pollutibacter soli TaxID=3034157 RepID=UPI0030138B49